MSSAAPRSDAVALAASRSAALVAALVSVAGGSLACRDQVIALPPLPTDARSALIAVVGSGGVALHASSLDVPGQVHAQALSSDQGTLVLLAYRSTLEDLQIGPGPVPRAPDGDPGRRLPEPALVFEAGLPLGDGEDGGDEAWHEREQMPPELAAVRIRAPDLDRCVDLGGCLVEQRCASPCDPPPARPALPEPPIEPLLPHEGPSLVPCPGGWIEIALEAEGSRACEPPAFAPACGGGEVAVFGGGCARVGAPCVAPGEWPDAGSRPAIHVAPGAPPGGDGSALAPLARISDAIDRAAPGGAVLLGAGRFEEALVLRGDVAVIGSCERTLIAPGAGEIAVTAASGSTVTLERLAITTSRGGVSVEAGATLTLAGVTVDAQGVGIFGLRARARSSVRVRDAVVRAAREHAVAAEAGAELDVERLAIEGGGRLGAIHVTSGARARIRDAVLSSSSGAALVVEAAEVSVERAEMTTHGTSAIESSSAALELSDVRVRGAGRPTAVLIAGGSLAARALAVIDAEGEAIGLTDGARARLEDVLVRSPGGLGIRGAAAEVELTRASIERAHVIGVRLVGRARTSTLADVIVRDTVSGGLTSAGVEVSGQRARLSRVLIARSYATGLHVASLAAVKGRSLFVLDTRDVGLEAMGAPNGHAILVDTGAGLELERAVLTRASGAGVYFESCELGCTSSATITDFTVRDADNGIAAYGGLDLAMSRASMSARDWAIVCHRREGVGRVRLDDVRTERGLGLLLDLPGELRVSRARVNDGGLHIEGRLELEASDVAVIGGRGAQGRQVGITIGNGTKGTLRRFITARADIGAFIVPWTDFELSEGVVEENAIGVSLPNHRGRHAPFQRVVYRDNGVNFLGGE